MYECLEILEVKNKILKLKHENDKISLISTSFIPKLGVLLVDEEERDVEREHGQDIDYIEPVLQKVEFYRSP